MHGIVRCQGGAIHVESDLGVGTSFSVYLPACDKPVTPARARSDVAWSGEATVLLVDDEEMIVDLATRILEGANLRVIDAGDGREAVEIFRERSNEIDLVLLDMTMPKLSGREVCDELRAVRDDVKIVTEMVET